MGGGIDIGQEWVPVSWIHDHDRNLLVNKIRGVRICRIVTRCRRVVDSSSFIRLGTECGYLPFQCLKESYVKALGIGIGFNLQRMSFNLKTLSLAPGTVAIDTTVDVDGLGQADWSFQETMLDSQHYVAVALKSRESEADGKDETEQVGCTAGYRELFPMRHVTLAAITGTTAPVPYLYWSQTTESHLKIGHP